MGLISFTVVFSLFLSQTTVRTQLASFRQNFVLARRLPGRLPPPFKPSAPLVESIILNSPSPPRSGAAYTSSLLHTALQ